MKQLLIPLLLAFALLTTGCIDSLKQEYTIVQDNESLSDHIGEYVYIRFTPTKYIGFYTSEDTNIVLTTRGSAVPISSTETHYIYSDGTRYISSTSSFGLNVTYVCKGKILSVDNFEYPVLFSERSVKYTK
jgi:hypothetical protein